ncbi:universal stress protein PHOS32 [Canna indica]|uniref:Universal stress protein PHOS32 n=1 Tax=Canna indica TaxID=4628 RepID=A0AAQ3JYV9_9LILI|nr:universal stress protein PHOS32 [Canna indica]
MGRASPRLPSFCLNRITTARVRVRSPPPALLEAKPPPSEQPEEAIKNPKEELSSRRGCPRQKDHDRGGGHPGVEDRSALGALPLCAEQAR